MKGPSCMYGENPVSELVQLKMDLEISVVESTPIEAETWDSHLWKWES